MLSEASDYPAAHSMDTTWFAVDRDGFVAEFFSGENGPVPSGSASDATGVTLERVTASLPRTTHLYDPAPGRQRQIAGSDAHREFWNETDEKLEHVLMIVSGPEPVADEVARGEAVPVPAVEGFGVVWRVLPRAVHARLHGEGHCLYCAYGFLTEAGEEQPDEIPSSNRGLFSYVHPGIGCLARAYARNAQPQEPVTLDQLPEGIREAVGVLRFSHLSFRESPFIHPVELVPECWTHRTVYAYVNTEGTMIRAVPGREEDYLEEMEELREAYPELTIEPPESSPQE